jgi:hypothetical protein
MGNVKTASAATVDDDAPVVPAPAGPVEADPQVSARALAEALDPQLVARLAAQARAQGVSLLGRDGLLQQLTKRFLEASLDAEMDEHLGYGRHELAGRNGGNSRNGKRSKTLLTEVGRCRSRCRATAMGRLRRRSWPSGSAASAASTIWSSR